ncbi:MAG: biotin--[acetyl-CoA-carboxylase] ligase [Sediminimonas sp.]|uniref:biotin--[acetyl-CoA-carboxylase] ligase n=1 Tax=Sediminimonas sp. TaxID=2823379 RepID=UPI0028707C3F|nr:biotin--[acetyl-CoA-carboxylase] ligase [Sediminimonas sp.]MDR9484400.1 biotin--[acetyl-CoA-carboxylase] ligase [Sediminimonas sp.]
MTEWPPGYDRIILTEVDSTLDEAVRRVGEVAAPTWIFAHHQSAARGRRGRTWSHPKGNFAATLVLPDVTPGVLAALRSFVASLALFDAFVAATGRIDPFAVKWPNDVLLNGGKVAGILLESISRQGAAPALAIGIGVNLAEAPPEDAVEAGALRPVALAQEAGAHVPPEEFLTLLAGAYADHETRLRQFGFAPLRQAWLERAARLGEVITARLPGEEITGVFETVDASGQLVLSTAEGRKVIAAADVFF